MLVGTLLAVWAAWLAAAASAAQIPVEDKEPKGCSFRGLVYAVGERWATGPPNKCAKYICEGDDQIAALTCPLFVPAPGCRVIPGDEGATYPGCCPLRKCGEPLPARPAQDHVVAATTPLTPTTAAPREATATPGVLAGRAAHAIIRLTLKTDSTTTAAAATTVAGAGDEEEEATGTVLVLTPTMTPPPAV